MPPSEDHPGNKSPEHLPSDLSTRGAKGKGPSQLEFELDFYGRILERDPHYADVVRVQAGNLAAVGEWHRALVLDRRLTRLQPDRPIPWYNLACSYSVLGMVEPGLRALQRALDLGYPRPARVLKDPDLRALRRDPRFGRILKKLS